MDGKDQTKSVWNVMSDSILPRDWYDSTNNCSRSWAELNNVLFSSYGKTFPSIGVINKDDFTLKIIVCKKNWVNIEEEIT